MAKYITTTDQNVALNDAIPFDTVSIPCNKGCVIPIAPGILTLKSSNTNNFARYDVTLQANVSIPTGGAVTPIALAITLNGVPVPERKAGLAVFPLGLFHQEHVMICFRNYSVKFL